jgi:hypothetical protein
MRKAFLFFVTLFLCFSFQAYSLIEECSSIQQLVSLARPSSQLILLDIDNTLLRPKQMLGSDEWFSYYLGRQAFIPEEKEKAFHRVLDLWEAIHVVSSVIPMEKNTAAVVRELQEMGCSLMAFTTRGSSLEYVTDRQLTSIGIHLSLKGHSNISFTLKNMPSVLFSKGVLFTNGTHKGQALREFLCQIGWMPDRIIFINDKQNQLEEASLGIPKTVQFLGLRYAPADEYVARFDPAIAEKQLQHFLHIPEDTDK